MNNRLPDLGPNTLIDEGDPPPFEVINPDGSASMLLVCDHASRAFPKKMGLLGLDASALDRHIAYDIGAEEITRWCGQDATDGFNTKNQTGGQHSATSKLGLDSYFTGHLSK